MHTPACRLGEGREAELDLGDASRLTPYLGIQLIIPSNPWPIPPPHVSHLALE